ncbi:MAG TPA: hypothetical protein VEU96_22185 [Bryobacteraceae bacterium]|nr:hypothetical protein [Bryobacteraceae bacterium]
MNRRRDAFALSVLFVLSAAMLDAQNLFVLPAANSGSATVNVFGTNPFAVAGSFAANPSATQVLSTADGLKLYIISNSSANTVMTVDSSFSTVRNIANLPQGATAAIISPDGKRLIVGTGGSIQVYDTTTDAPVVANGITISGIVIDLAASLDGARLFALVNTGIGTNLIAIDLSTNTIVTTLTIPGFANGVSAGPNGFIYVSTQNLFMEIDPRDVTVRQQVGMNARPGKMVFTPDGRLGLAPNLTPITGTCLLSIDLVSRTLGVSLPRASFPANTMLDKLFSVDANRVIGFSSVTQAVFDISLSSATAAPFLSGFGAISAAAVSSDIATPVHPSTQYLFVIGANQANRLDLSANLLNGSLPVPSSSGPITVAGAAASGTPVSMLTFGDHQAVALNGTSLPLVVRVLDVQGRPLAKSPVVFSVTAPGATLTAANVFTNIDGFAETTLIAPNTLGALNVLASAGDTAASFTVNVGKVGGGVTGGLVIIAGQGELLPPNTSTSVNGSPLIVRLNDLNGNPVPNTPITFTIATGQGTLVGPPSDDPLSTVVTTDTKGLASINFLTTVIPSFPGFLNTTIVASSPDGANVTFFVTTFFADNQTGLTGTSIQLLQPSQGANLSGQAGQTLTGAIQIQVVNPFGPIPNVGLQLVNLDDPTQPPLASCKGTVALTNEKGIASCDIVLGGQLGPIHVSPLVGSNVTLRPITINVTAGAPGVIVIKQGDKQSGRPGDALPLALAVQVTDVGGNPLPGTTVSWKVVTAGSATLSNVVNTTDNQGRASANVTLGTVAGTFQITVTAGTITQKFTFTVLIPAAGLTLVSGNNQSAQVNTAFAAPLAVQVLDGQGNGFAGAQVTFAVTSGVATILGATATTNAQGIATTGPVTAGGSAGPITITATFGSFAVAFNLNARLPGPTNITFVNGASFQTNTMAGSAPCPPPGCISPGEILTINATGMLPGVQGVVSGINILGQLPTSLPNGFSVTFSGIAAPIFYVANIGGVESATVQVPFELPVGTAAVVINAVGGGTGNTNVAVQAAAPGIFTTGTSQNFAVAVRADGSYISSGNAPNRGETIGVFVNGLGQVTPPTGTGRTGVAGQAVNATVIVGLSTSGGISATKAEYAVGLVGVYLVTITIPPNATPGPSQSLVIAEFDQQGKVYFSQTAFIPIQ